MSPLSGHFATLVRETVRTLLADHDVYVCGADGWMDAVRTAALEAGATREAVHLERFAY